MEIVYKYKIMIYTTTLYSYRRTDLDLFLVKLVPMTYMIYDFHNNYNRDFLC